MNQQYLGLDFGTTNSAVALTTDGGATELVALPDPAGATLGTWRSILFIEAGDRRSDNVFAGPAAIERFIAAEGEGRLVQSIKSHLASSSFTSTMIAGRRWTLEELIASFLMRLRQAAGRELGDRVVCGRPVRYWGARDDADDARAVARMRKALELAGFVDIVFEYEPVAAAHRYSCRLDHDELVLIADFGGGTSDFSLAKVGPSVNRGGAEVLATSGVGIGGDTFDGRIIDHLIAPLLGKGSQFSVPMSGTAPVPAWLFAQLRRWHQLSFLRTPKALQLLERIQQGADEPEQIQRFVHLVENDLGLPLHRSIEASKLGVSLGQRAPFELVHWPLEVHAELTRSDFEDWIERDLVRIEAALDEVLARAGVGAAEVERVFATGGSSLVPAVHALLARRFGQERVVGGEELTSVAWGLARRAREVFA